jgi:ferrochelatase
LPERILTWNDPYQSQLLETCELVAQKIPGITWSFSFQSAGNTDEPWLGPDINDALVTLGAGGKKNIVICPVGFVSDNLEIVYDLDIESQAVAHEHGINLSRTEMRNTNPLFIRALYDEAIRGIVNA